MDELAATNHVRSFMFRIAEHLRATFPHFSGALRQQIEGVRMTNGRWHRAAEVLEALSAIPGEFLEQRERDERYTALCAVAVAQRMAAGEFGYSNQAALFASAVELADEISAKMGRAGCPDGPAPAANHPTA